MKGLSLDSLKFDIKDIKLSFNNVIIVEAVSLVVINILIFLLFSQTIGKGSVDKKFKINNIRASIAKKMGMSEEEKSIEVNKIKEMIAEQNRVYGIIEKKVSLINNNTLEDKDEHKIVDEIVKIPYVKDKIDVGSVRTESFEEGVTQSLGEYKELNIKIQLKSTYRDLIDYLAKFDKLSFPAYLASVDISVSEYPILQVDLSLFTLVKGDGSTGGAMPMGPLPPPP